MPQKTNWPLILVLLGTGLLGLSWLISKKVDQTTAGLHVLANIEPNTGKTEVFRREMKSKELLKKKTQLYSLDSAETGLDSEATLEFETGDRLKMSDNTQIVLDEESGHTVVWLKNGDLQVEARGKDGSLLISKNGKRMSMSQYENSEHNNKGFEGPKNETTKKQDENTPTDTTLNPEYIRTVLNRQKNIFYKCYTQLLQRTPGVTGEATISFTIERTGKTSQAEIASSSLYDANFKRCLTDGIARVEFKSFNGDPISTVFPLKFE